MQSLLDYSIEKVYNSNRNAKIMLKKAERWIIMNRDIIKELTIWKTRKDRKPLLLTGVRQCGKTYSLLQFAQEQFQDVAYFNFEEDDTLSAVFDHDYKVNRIIDELGSVIRRKEILPGKTLVIFDEIQACPRAITSLKYFCENLPELHLIGAGSLLGVALRAENISFPVGKVNRLEMFPMSFSEFVSADGGENLINGLGKTDPALEIPAYYTVPLIRYLKLYYLIGGMPEVVRIWTETHSFEKVMEKQDEILSDYADDFGKHAPPAELTKIRLIWESIPSQLAKDNNKFVFSHVKSGMRAKDLEDALEWLVNAGLVSKLFLVEKPQIPLSGEADRTAFKVYLSDTGLLCRRARIHYRTIMDSDDQFIHFKGALTENYVLTQLRALHINTWFWRSAANAEIDFLTDEKGCLLPIEVKSADNTKAKSLHLFCSRYSPALAIKTSLKNVGDSWDGNTHVRSLPLYALFRLKETIDLEIGISQPSDPS